MYRHLENGGFVVRRSGRIRFNSVSTDQSLSSRRQRAKVVLLASLCKKVHY